MEDTGSYQEEGVPVPFSSKKREQVRKSVSSWYYFGVAGEIGFAVALPIAGGAILGTAIDSKLHTYPDYTVILLFAGLVLSMINFIMVVQTILKRKQ